VRHPPTGIFAMLGGKTETSLVEQADDTLAFGFTHTIVVDLRSGEYHAPLRAGRWQLRLTVRGLGFDPTEPMTLASDVPERALIDGRPVAPYISRSGNLALAVDVPKVSLVTKAGLRPGDVHVTHGVSGSRLVLELPHVHVAGDGQRACAVRIGKLPVPARLVADGATGRARIESWLSALPGRHRLALDLDGQVTPLGLDAVVAQDGGVTIARTRPAKKPASKPVRAPRLRAMARRVPGLRGAYRAVRQRPAGDDRPQTRP
jgi:hypothetical protein